MKKLLVVMAVLLMAAGLAWAEDAATEVAQVAEPLAEAMAETLDQSCPCNNTCFSDFQCMFFVGPGSTCEPTGPCGCNECTTSQSSKTGEPEALMTSVEAPVCDAEESLLDGATQACSLCLPECRRDRDCRRRFGKGSVCIIDTRCGCNTCAVAF